MNVVHAMQPCLSLSTLLPLHWDVPYDRLGGWIHRFALGHVLPSVKTDWRILFLHLAQQVKTSARKSTKPHFYSKMRVRRTSEKEDCAIPFVSEQNAGRLCRGAVHKANQ
jgi:hypothetical protein